MDRHQSLLTVLGLVLVVLPTNSYAESRSTKVDMSLALTTTTPMPNSGDTITVELTVSDGGDFGISRARVSVPVPAGLTFVSSDGEPSDYDVTQGIWTTGAISSFGSATLQLTLLVDADGPPAITVVADLLSIEGSFGSYDPDSFPGNANPCEDDYAALQLAIVGRRVDAGVAGGDAGPDAGPACPGPGASVDAGSRGTGESGGGCSLGSHSTGGWPLIMLGLLLALRRR